MQAQLEDVQCIQASDSSFAAIRGDGSVVTWGDPDYLSWAQPNTGCDSAVVQQQLVDVQFIQASSVSFAAVLGDGSVVTWGDAPNGGDSSAVQDQLRSSKACLLLPFLQPLADPTCRP